MNIPHTSTGRFDKFGYYGPILCRKATYSRGRMIYYKRLAVGFVIGLALGFAVGKLC